MSTTIHSTVFKTALNLAGTGAGTVIIDLSGPGGEYESPDVIAAFEKELNGIFIDKTDLPEVDEGTAGDASAFDRVGNCNGIAWADLALGRLRRGLHAQPEWHRARALAHLAMAEYLVAHPPVDEQQVEALAGLIESAATPPRDEPYTDLARRIIQTGKVTVSD